MIFLLQNIIVLGTASTCCIKICLCFKANIYLLTYQVTMESRPKGVPLFTLLHTASEPSSRVNSMNQHFWLQNIKIYHKNNRKCHFAKYSSFWSQKCWFIELTLPLGSDTVCYTMHLNWAVGSIQWTNTFVIKILKYIFKIKFPL